MEAEVPSVHCCQVYLKDDYIVREGEVAREMYFLKSGAVQAGSGQDSPPTSSLVLHHHVWMQQMSCSYLHKAHCCRCSCLPHESPFSVFVGLMACLLQVEVRGQMVTLLKKGSYFGEIGLLRNARRSACVRAVSDTCDLFVLTKVGPAAWHNAPATEWVDDCKGCIRCMQRHLLASSGCTAQSDGIEMILTHQDLA